MRRIEIVHPITGEVKFFEVIAEMIVGAIAAHAAGKPQVGATVQLRTDDGTLLDNRLGFIQAPECSRFEIVFQGFGT